MNEREMWLTFDGVLLDSSSNIIRENNINHVLITKIFKDYKILFQEVSRTFYAAENKGKPKAKTPLSSVGPLPPFLRNTCTGIFYSAEFSCSEDIADVDVPHGTSI